MSPGSVEAAADRTARTKMMATLFYRVSLWSQSYADASKRGVLFSRSRDIRRGLFRFPERRIFASGDPTTNEKQTDAEDPNGKKRGSTKRDRAGVDARREATGK